MGYLPNLTNNSLSTVRRAVIAVAPALLFPTAIYGAASLPTTLPTSVPVNVTNTPLSVIATSPLPVNGTVNATQSGAWSVGIVGTPTVNLASPIAVSSENQAKNAFHVSLVAGECVTQPAGKRAVITFATSRLQIVSLTGTEEAPYAIVRTQIKSALTDTLTNVDHFIPQIQKITPPAALIAVYVAATPVQIFADSGICANQSAGNNMSLSLSGYLVDKP
jgi:hypothetical protein